MKNNYKILCPDKKYFSIKGYSLLKQNLITDYKDLSQTTFEKKINNYDFVITRFMKNLDKKTIIKSKLKAILSVTTGLDHLDIQSIKKNKIKLFHLNNKKFLKEVRASIEHSFFLIFYAIKNYLFIHKSKKINEKLVGRNLHGKTIGIIGFGRIGRELSKLLIPFGVKIIFFEKKKIKDFRKKNIKRVNSLKRLFEISDIISVNISLNKNENLINKNLFKYSKKNMIFINTSRGQIVNTLDLLSFLKKNKKACAALDVVDPKYENLCWNFSKKFNNLILTPHIAGLTKESIELTDLYLINKFLLWYKKNK